MVKPVRSWFEEDPELFEEETLLLTARGFSLDQEVFQSEKKVLFHGKLQDERTAHIELPSGFPSFPPRMTDDISSPLLHRHHSATERQFCLFGPGGRDWRASMHAVEAIDCANELLVLPKTATNDVVPEPLSAQIKTREKAGYIIFPYVSEYKPADPLLDESGTCKIMLPPTLKDPPGTGVGFVVSLNVAGREIGMHPKAPRLSGLPKLQPITAPFHYFSAAEPLQILKARIIESLLKRGLKFAPAIFVFPEESGNRTTRRLGWVVAWIGSHNELHAFETFVYNREELLARIPSVSPLLSKRILLLGCGCLGSKVGLNLAISRFENCFLVDRDSVEPGNLVRHEADLYQIGMTKVDALRAQMERKNPFISVFGAQWAIGGLNPNEESKLHEEIERADIVIETTGIWQVKRYVNEVVYKFKKPAIYVSITNGAWGGEVVQIHPEFACLQCWSTQFSAAEVPSEPRNGLFFAPGCDQPTFTGTNFDAGIVANLATSFAVETLRTKPMSSQYVKWGLRNREGFFAPSIEQIVIPRREKCAICNP
jgi:molybdopterin/thiamine biosynthesis adenylyltransferase